MIIITTTKKQQELIYKIIVKTCREMGYNISETKKLMIYNKLVNKRSRKGK